MKLIIVESPTKARTLSKFLKGKYTVEATMGHIRDLPKSELGVDVEHEFEPKYIIPRLRTKRVHELKALAKKADEVLLATDPDREGEAIAWHVASLLTETRQKAKGKRQNLQRIVFHEITESAIKEAIENPRSIDVPLVDAQQARRVLDRLVGYKLSPLLWQKLSRRWLSAGRVQSVAVRLIVEREREIEKFTKEEYWTIEGVFLCHPGLDPGSNPIKLDSGSEAGMTVRAQLISKDSIKYEKTLTLDLFDGKYTTTSSTIRDERQAREIIADFCPPFTVSAVDKKEVNRSPYPPYTTSTLQQDAGRKLGFSAKRTMQLAQKLYEEGYITYHRTDSFNLAEKFIAEARDYIEKTYGKAYVAHSPRRYKTKSKVAQEAHEAVRPTDAGMSHDTFPMPNEDINRDHKRLYELIWKRAVATQATDAVYDATGITITSGNSYVFTANGSVIRFEGFLVITGRDAEDRSVPDVRVGDMLGIAESIPTGHESSAPPRYTEASLVKTLEEKGIGRPSTYAPTISTIQDRQYVVREDKKLKPTDLGCTVTDFLVLHFPAIINLPFTAALENDLDAIANGEKQWKPVIAAFWTPFAESLAKTYLEAQKVQIPVEAFPEPCPECKSPLVIRSGKFGKFIACSTFPACKYTRQFLDKAGIPCPRCGGDIVNKKSKKGKTFYGCSNYPKCDYAAWKKEDIK